ncbi:hypothetical protein JDV09_10800 [Mycobacterium sp. Y57]|uniref:hypothetical protein n=1 Tax=Mycolicibacterium xanthum TaxID=2796469 RepID=UPI001C85746B|nr:hypothetical protein [Mycolicibacterium xanthum]MBX7432587.1 hypothetical protein [Mycolicibacterium xanthum]
MTTPDQIFKAFNNFGSDDLPADAVVSRRMLQRLQSIDNPELAGPQSPEGRAALASSVVAHAVVELEAEIIALKQSLSANAGTSPRQ